MKKLLIYVCMSVAVFNCDKVKPDSGNSDMDAIIFDDVQTKAFVNSADQILSMGVFAQMNLGDEGDPGYLDYLMLLDNEHVQRTSSEDPWTYEHTRYWVPDRAWHFFAVWPYSGDPDSPVTNASSVAGDGPYAYNLTFNTPENADQELLTATKTERTVTGYPFPGSVDFQFEHQLTNVNFKIWRNGSDEGIQDRIKIKQVVLSNVTQKGTLTTTLSGSSWSHSSNKMSFTKEYTNPGINDISAAQIIDGQLVTDGTDNPAVPFGDEGLLLIPHTVTSSNAVIVKVIYDLQRPIDQEEDIWEEKTLQAFLPEGTWPAGKRVTFNMIISGERTITQFQINTVVEDWVRHSNEIDFSENVTTEGHMEWVEGTYDNHDPVNCRVIVYTDDSIAATCRFKIKTPVGASWTASLIPLTASAMDAFSIVENTKYGIVGTDEWQYVKIKVNNLYPITSRNECILRITVQTLDGRTIVVKDMMPGTAAAGIEEYTIVQNLING